MGSRRRLNGVDFNRYKDTYREEIEKAVSFTGLDVDFFTEVKANCLLRIAKKFLGEPGRLRVLDVGCGIGLTDNFLASHFKEMHGVDVAGDLIEKAARINPSVCYHGYDGDVLPFSDASFDLVFAICVMHHLPYDVWMPFLKELKRVTKKGCLTVIFEHNPFNPITRLVISRTPIDADALLITGGKMKNMLEGSGLEVVERKYLLFFPFRGPLFAGIEKNIGWLPLGAQYYVAGRKGR
ncbi:MAG: methyltransferase domain-containing protein [Nitrospirae bacterium]|nr:methyltransferase domain-containing protein [Nitrospirota bacterium]